MPFIECNGMRVLFIHIPKTGGTTVESWLRSLAPLRFHSVGLPPASRCTPQHYRMQDLRDLLGPDYFDYAFTLVRNPYDRIASEYRMHAAIRGQGFWKAWPSFSLWLEENIRRQALEPFHLDNHLRPQWEFVGSNVDVFRFEDGLEAALAPVAARLGLPAPTNLPHLIQSSVPAPEWDRADRLRVQEHYRLDFSEFGYAS